MKLTCSAFSDGGKIPDEYTMYGQNKVPPLTIEDVPPTALSLALILDDPDAPQGTFTHWLLFNLDPQAKKLNGAGLPEGTHQGLNDYGEAAYGGPKPPSGEHRYFFKVYALDTLLSGEDGVKRPWLESAMHGHILEDATLMGRYAH
jgi:Raf kinase inhibitor-like YbhB/YbcL family protein